MKINIIFLFGALTLHSCISPSNDNLDTKPAVGQTTNGKKEGEWKTFYTNGQVAKIENYLNDTLNGQLSYFDEKGNIKGRQFYRMGVKVDSSKMYFSNGQVNQEEKKDSTGKTQGLFKVHHQNGQLSQIVFMKDNYLNDTCKTFFDNGQLKTLEFYKDRKKEGTWLYYSKRGTLIRKEVYNNDNLIDSKD